MDKKEIDIRNRAAKTFMDNFEKQLDIALQETQIEENNSELANTPKKSKEYQSDEEFNLSKLEEAIADIDEYIQTNQKQQPSSTSE
ncbi:MAG: hypothetical protein F6K40_04880 [Okeania sp. SIO3I5]|uniref:hypothetical protein n=1 Tax=Okeania sp. SIO3I5 TaxID=2607805 RepID=UPI0013BAD30F|nr:hypothetical protein [Okeania sp. SIO3I5]NEQ35662.1 hypothetical protein [Okeania sp. SIO3I5]